MEKYAEHKETAERGRFVDAGIDAPLNDMSEVFTTYSKKNATFSIC